MLFPSNFNISFRFTNIIFLHVHISSYITQAGLEFLLFKRNTFLIFLVTHFILILYKSLVSSWKHLEDVSFFSQYGISIKITCFFISKKPGGKM